jgi:hypothetical protein
VEKEAAKTLGPAASSSFFDRHLFDLDSSRYRLQFNGPRDTHAPVPGNGFDALGWLGIEPANNPDAGDGK